MSAFRDTLKPVFAETDGKKSADSSEKQRILSCAASASRLFLKYYLQYLTQNSLVSVIVH